MGVTWVTEVVAQLLTSPTVAQGDCDGPLPLGLADDVAIQLGDDLAGRQVALVHDSCLRNRLVVPAVRLSKFFRIRTEVCGPNGGSKDRP